MSSEGRSWCPLWGHADALHFFLSSFPPRAPARPLARLQLAPVLVVWRCPKCICFNGSWVKLLSRQPRTQVNVISEAWEHSEGSPRGKLRRTGRGSRRCGWAGSAQGAGVSDRESPGWALGAGSWLCTSVRSGVILQAAVVKGCPLAFRVLVGLGSGLMAIL